MASSPSLAAARYSRWAELDHFASTDQLLVFACHFLDEWLPDEIGVLPAGAWPVRPRSADELVAIALRIERVQCAYGPGPAPRLVAELLAFFTQVAIRALRLQLPAAIDPPRSRGRS